MSVSSAPGELERVRRFVNTRQRRPDREDLGSPRALSSKLVELGLLERQVRLTDADLDRALDVRESLRDALRVNAGLQPAHPRYARSLERALRAAPLTLNLDRDGSPRLEPVGEGLDAALGRLAAAISTATVEGTWRRLKACAADDCGWAFYDSSRNRAGVWCDMSDCGNRAKVRAYRARQAHSR